MLGLGASAKGSASKATAETGPGNGTVGQVGFYKGTYWLPSVSSIGFTWFYSFGHIGLDHNSWHFLCIAGCNSIIFRHEGALGCCGMFRPSWDFLSRAEELWHLP